MTMLLSKTDIGDLLDMEEAIVVMEAAFADYAHDRVLMPQRLVITVSRYQGVCGFMPAYVHSTGALGAKTVAAFKKNRERQLPTLFGTVMLLDDETGQPLAIMDGADLTSVRTGAASGVASRHLARPDAHLLGVLGSGEQAVTQIVAICAVRPIEEVRVYSPHLEQKKELFLRRVGGLVAARIQAVATAEAAVRDCDIVAVATNAERPVFDGAWLSPGTHINGVGSHSPQARELDTTTVRRSRIVCDAVDACLVEAGDLMLPIANGDLSREEIHGSLGEVVCGEKKGRTDDEEITLFKSVGLAFQDISMAWHVYERATRQGVGVHFDFFA